MDRYIDDLVAVLRDGGDRCEPLATLRAIEAERITHLFTGMVAVDQLAEIGLRPDGTRDGPPWSRPALVDPAPVAGMPRGLALVPAAAAMLRWKLRGRGR